MKRSRITRAGPISIPAWIRRRWGTSAINLARGALADEVTMSSEQLREIARRDEAAAEARRAASR
jgi:hypothetical protein